MTKISWKSTKGQVIELEASFTETMEDQKFCSETTGDWIGTGKRIKAQRAELNVFVGGEMVDSCTQIRHWEIVNAEIPGLKRIVGIQKIAFTAEKAKEVEAFLNKVIADGKAPEVVEVEKEKKLENAKKVITKAETTVRNANGTLMSKEQANQYLQQYQQVMNDGCEGFVPNIITQEAYDRALQIVNES